MKNSVFFLCVLLFAASCSQKNSIEGKIQNLGSDTLFIAMYPIADAFNIQTDDDLIRDTIVAANDKFAYNPPFDQPVLLIIWAKSGIYKRISQGDYLPESSEILVFWKPGDKLKITGIADNYFVDYQIAGNEFNRDNSLIRKQLFENFSKSTQIEMQLDTLMFYNPHPEIKQSKDSIEHSDAIIKELFQLRTELTIANRKPRTDYVANHPDKELSGYYLALSLPLDTLGKYYETLGEEVKAGVFKDILEKQLKRYNNYLETQKAKERIREGNAAPDFTLKDISGNDLSLYSIEKEYVVLDFWGSWCGWCIKGFPKMKDYYKKYRQRLEILGIDCRDTEEKWKEAVEEYQLDWRHVINSEDNDVPVKYAVEGYPTKIILDRDKKIVAVFLGESDEFYKKLDGLLKK
jgi:thiol-disulfide isomerase/thioredoxin